MKLSKNFVKDYVDIDVDIKELAEDMTRVGNEYDSAGKLLDATNLVIGEVKECEMHPDSDHLHVCKVDIGREVLNIVCGAPNVRKGLKVIVALDGAVLPGVTVKAGGGIEKDDKPRIIKRSMVRGQESNGMLCSMLELGLEHKYADEVDKTGIHELPSDAPVGEDPIAYMGMDDEVVDFDLTANRGDLLSILGMAYELGAIYDKDVKDIDLSHKENSENINDSFKVEVNTENCSIFLARKVKNIKIGESPAYIKNRLIASGIRPINNVVDISNYVMLETGQPLHFYDADTLKGKIEVRMAKEGEKLFTLDGKERTLSNEDIVISDGERAIGLAGVMGGLDTEITDSTKNVLIESAIFDGVKIRKTSKEILRSEASSRFEKGLDPNRTYMALERAAKLLEEYASGEVVGGIAKYDKENLKNREIEISFKNINDVLGMNIAKKDVLDVFRRLKFEVYIDGKKSEFKEQEKDLETIEKITVSVPRRRGDISIKEDLIEEVGRIYGVDNIVGRLPEMPMKAGSYDKVTRGIRNKMVDLGLNETLSYILVNDKEAKYFTKDDTELVSLLDPMTEERNTLRHSILPSLLKIYEYNKARSNKDVSIFEIGKAFYKKGEEYGETNKIAALMTGDYYLGIGSKKQVDFYVIKGIVEELLDYLGYGNRYSFVIKEDKMPEEVHPGQTALISVNNDIVGLVGRVHPALEKEAVYVFEIDLDKLLDKKVGKMKYKEISKFPSVKKDLAVVVDKNVTAEEIAVLIKKAGGSSLSKIEAFDVYTGKGIDENKKSIAYSLTFEKMDRTLTDEEINQSMEKIVEMLNKKIGAELRK
jgi:phenylalanyl-tRNA synthetase beta chain